MKDHLPPFSQLFDTILNEHAYPGVTTIVDVDEETYTDIPVLVWNFLNQGQYDHGLWAGVLTVTVLCEPRDAKKLLAHVYKQVHQWELPDRGEVTSERLGIETVSDTLVFDTFSQTANINGKDVAQYNAQFRLTITDYS